jgi:hypothetical protein
MIVEGVAVDVDAAVRPAVVRVELRIPRATPSLVVNQAVASELRHRDVDSLLDFDVHDCVLGSSFCHVCEVQRAQREGRRV